MVGGQPGVGVEGDRLLLDDSHDSSDQHGDRYRKPAIFEPAVLLPHGWGGESGQADCHDLIGGGYGCWSARADRGLRSQHEQ